MLLQVVLFVFASSSLTLTVLSSGLDDANFSQDLQKAFDLIPAEKLPMLKDDNSHWCCRLTLNPIVMTQTRIVTDVITNGGKYRCGYDNCGFLGWGSCSRWCENYWQQTIYHEQTYTFAQEQQCPLEHVTCCAGFYNIHGHCLSIDEIRGNPELLGVLAQQGIFLPEGK